MAIPAEIVEETRRRFQGRSVEREGTLRRIEEGPPVRVDSPERVRARIERLERAARGAGAAAADGAGQPRIGATIDAAGAARQDVARLGLERVLGKDNLIGIAYLELGLLVSRSVGRILIRRGRLRIDGFGTGFLVSPTLLLTNHHVLRDAETAATSQLELNFQTMVDGRPEKTTVFDLDPRAFFVTSRELDYTIVGVKENGAGKELAAFGWNGLIAEQGKALLGESLNIIQHPNGEPKQLALRENLLVDVLPDFLHYQTDTAPGSSGSPVFNDQWEVVALHHSGVPRTNDQGDVLALGGDVWTPAMGEHRIDWLANEGVRVSQIVAHLNGLTMPGDDQRRLRDALVGGATGSNGSPFAGGGLLFTPLALPSRVAPPPNVVSPPPVVVDPGRLTGVDGSGAGLAMNAGVVSFTVPLTISVQLGAIVAGSATPAAPPIAAASSTTSVPADSEERRRALEEARAARTRIYFDEGTNARDVRDYYADVDETAASGTFFQALHTLLDETHETRPAYKPAVHVYPWVDLQEDGKLRSIYSSIQFEPEELIDADFRTDELREERLRERLATESLSGARSEEALDLLEAALPYNCEHVVPQSWFNKKEPMRGDLHHLFACEVNCNSFRGNIAYFDFPDFEEVVRHDCGKRETGRFEPGAGKGTVARATLYFLLRYPGLLTGSSATDFNEDRLQVLLAWHATHPVSKYEKHRNQAIFAAQGNRNPLIDHPEWANRIAFRSGLR